MLFFNFDISKVNYFFVSIELQLATAGARCDFGLYLGASLDNMTVLPSFASHSVALKMYLNDTFSDLRLDDMSIWMKVCKITRLAKMSLLSLFSDHAATKFVCGLFGLVDLTGVPVE